MAQLVTRVDDELATAVDDLIAAGRLSPRATVSEGGRTSRPWA
jgi:hypothetical protein